MSRFRYPNTTLNYNFTFDQPSEDSLFDTSFIYPSFLFPQTQNPNENQIWQHFEKHLENHLDNNQIEISRDVFMKEIKEILEMEETVMESRMVDFIGFENMPFIQFLLDHHQFLLLQLKQQQLQQLQQQQQQYRNNEKEEEDRSYIYSLYKTKSEFQKQMKVSGFDQFYLPPGTKREDTKTYERVDLPLPPTAPPINTTTTSNTTTTEIRSDLPPLKEINILPQWAHNVFPNYKSFNRIQSIVYDQAFLSNQNLLIAAPTGAGKTDIAVLCILSCVRQYFQKYGHNTDAGINPMKMKIIYIAPMKALVTELHSKLKRKLKPLNLKVEESTGDLNLPYKIFKETHVLITTPEKYDILTRKRYDLEFVKCLILDEVHLLQDDRGTVLESIVCRTLRMSERQQRVIRMVGLSATLPNVLDVAQFLNVKCGKNGGLFCFDETFRPVPLQQSVIGVKGKPGSPLVKKRMYELTYEEVVSVLKEEGKQVMVFVHARKETERTAKQILEIHQSKRSEGFGIDESLFSIPNDKRQSKLFVELEYKMKRCQFGVLRDLWQFGMGVHHAGMLRGDRLLVESMFEKGFLRVLVCTSTLAW